MRRFVYFEFGATELNSTLETTPVLLPCNCRRRRLSSLLNGPVWRKWPVKLFCRLKIHPLSYEGYIALNLVQMNLKPFVDSNYLDLINSTKEG